MEVLPVWMMSPSEHRALAHEALLERSRRHAVAPEPLPLTVSATTPAAFTIALERRSQVNLSASAEALSHSQGLVESLGRGSGGFVVRGEDAVHGGAADAEVRRDGGRSCCPGLSL
ncbi:hypothetical protein OG566_36110 [Streptomyces sp. NBC_01353]|nr:hypothetical protein [Streptomyces sp. NBC_01353]